MRENQRGGLDKISSGPQTGRTKSDLKPEARPQQEGNSNVTADMNRSNAEGMVYIDIIPRFAL